MHTRTLPPLLAEEAENKTVIQLNSHLNKLWETLCYYREMDHHGKIVCRVCKKEKPYTHMQFKNYYRSSNKYPLNFVHENVYFCCIGCEIKNRQETKVYKMFQQYPNMYYNKQDIIEAICLLQRILKNHIV